MFLKLISTAISAAMLISIIGTTDIASPAVCASPTAASLSSGTPDYAEALQKSLYFYECQQAGPLPEWNRVEWRDDSTMTDEIKGGWYDAGDHVKFNLPMAYSASMLAWGIYQYPDGVEKSGEMTNYVNNLEFVLDYLADCDFGSEIVYQVGNGTIDHTWWGPVELIRYGMEDSGTSYEDARAVLKSSEGCAAVFGEMSAALASGYCALDGRIDEKKRQEYLEHAENIFKLADASPNNDVYNDSNASNFYRSRHFYDELFYAANWLYIATGNNDYLKKAESYIPNLDKELGDSTQLKYTWSHCWDDVMQGAMLLYAMNTNDSKYIAHVEKHLKYLANDTKKIEGKLAYMDNWGCLRYAVSAAFISAVACDTVLKDKDTSAYEKFYEDQINFVLGENSDNFSYVVGYGENSPKNPHHRTAHASWKNAEAYPVMSRHTLYGALVGGPNEDGSYEDNRGNYVNNEVADDYNAGFTAILCKMLDKYGGKSDPSFPPKEVHDGPEFYVETLCKGSTGSGITLSFKVTNHSAWPARIQDNISFRYYMDLSEFVDAGTNPEDIVIRCDRDQSAMYSDKGVKQAEISNPIKYDGNIYYIEVNLPDGRAVMPVSEGMQQCEILIAFVCPNYGSGWDASNDFSNKDILSKEPETDENGSVKGIVSPYVPVYLNGELYYGYEPDGTYKDGLGDHTNPDPVPDINYGDTDCDGKIYLNDAVLIMQAIGNPDEYGVGGTSKTAITEQGLRNADVSGNGDGLTNMDALTIQKYLLHMLDKLPDND